MSQKYTVEEFSAALAELLGTALSGEVSAPVKKGRAAKVTEPEDVVDEDVEADEVDQLDEEETRGLGIKDLRALAVELELDAQKVKTEILDELAAKGYFGDAEEADDEDAEDEADEEDDDESDDEDEDEGYTEDELQDMTLAQVKKVAKDLGLTVPRGADQDSLIELILGGDDEEDDDEDLDESEEADEDEGDEEVLDEDALNAMTIAELKELAGELEIKVRVPATAKTAAKKKSVYVEAILASGDE